MKTIIDVILVAIVILILALLAFALTHHYYGYPVYSGMRYYSTQPVQNNQGIYLQQNGTAVVPVPQQTQTQYYYSN